MSAGKRAWIPRTISGIFIGVVATAGVVLLYSQPRYSILHRFGATPRVSSWTALDHSRSGLKCYSFTGSYDEVLAASKRDLGEDGWKVRFSDPAITIFQRRQGGALQQATLAARLPEWKFAGEAPSVACMLWVPYSPSWIESEVRKIESRITHRSPKLEPTQVDPYDYDVSYYGSVKRKGKAVEAEIFWRNFDESPATVTVTAAYLSGYESDEDFPTDLVVPAMRSTVQRLTFPFAAGEDPSKLEVGYKFSDLQSSGEEDRPTTPREPSIAMDPSSHSLNISNGHFSRVYEIKDLKLLVNGKRVQTIVGPLKVLPGSSISIPMHVSPGDDPELTFNYRLEPNTRWQEFDFGDE